MELDAFYGLPSAPPNRIVHKNESTKMHVSRARTPNTTTTIHTALSANSFFLVEGLFSRAVSLLSFFFSIVSVQLCAVFEHLSTRFGFSNSLSLLLRKAICAPKGALVLFDPPSKNTEKKSKKEDTAIGRKKEFLFLTPQAKGRGFPHRTRYLPCSRCWAETISSWEGDFQFKKKDTEPSCVGPTCVRIAESTL